MALNSDSCQPNDICPTEIGSDAGQPGRLPARLRFARELHDYAGWHIAALNYGLFAAERDPGNPEKLKELRYRLNALSMALRELTERTRAKPHQPRDLPLALAALCRCWTAASGVAVDFRSDRLTVVPSTKSARTLVSIAREALTNTAKHAPTASRVTVELRSHGAHLRLEIADDGRGMNLDRLGETQGDGHGLHGMRERVAVLGGTIEIQCGGNGGARVVAVVPHRVSPWRPRPDSTIALDADASEAKILSLDAI